MRAIGYLMWMRIREQPGRTAYLAGTLAVSVIAWLVLSTFAAPFLVNNAGSSMNAEINVSNARVSSSPYPLKHALEIANMPGVRGVSYHTLAGFRCSDGRSVVSINAYGGDLVPELVQERGADAAMFDAWSNTSNGLLVGQAIAAKCGLTPGMTLTPRDVLSGVETPVTVVGILPPSQSSFGDQAAFGHYSYINNIIPEERRDLVMRVRVRGQESARLSELANEIETKFAGSDPPLQADTGSSTDSALARFGQIQSLLMLIMGAMLACATLVLVTVLAHAVSQRRSTMATLQTIGFGRAIQFQALALELFVIALLGAGAGVIAAYGLLKALAPATSWLLGSVAIPEWALLTLPVGVLGLMAISLAWPASTLSGLRPIDHLRI
ncbi:hypothetical protein LDO31_18435 [Luteimonas sp. XNQY3]|nr:hypothetical protein [Luteimonas sp. XNQY3]